MSKPGRSCRISCFYYGPDLLAQQIVGMVADDTGTPIKTKQFHCRIINDYERLKFEQEDYKPIPEISPRMPLLFGLITKELRRTWRTWCILNGAFDGRCGEGAFDNEETAA